MCFLCCSDPKLISIFLYVVPSGAFEEVLEIVASVVLIEEGTLVIVAELELELEAERDVVVIVEAVPK